MSEVLKHLENFIAKDADCPGRSSMMFRVVLSITETSIWLNLDMITRKLGYTTVG
jgi:hypothetical protein